MRLQRPGVRREGHVVGDAAQPGAELDEDIPQRVRG